MDCTAKMSEVKETKYGRRIFAETPWGQAFFYGVSASEPDEEDIGGLVIDNKSAPAGDVIPVVVVTTWGTIETFETVKQATDWLDIKIKWMLEE